MRAWLERTLQSIWYGDRPVPWVLSALTPLYETLSRRRLTRQRAAAEHPGVPVIVVGNISVGGSGKTPLVLWLVQRLVNAGFRPGIVTRGYGGKVRDVPHLVDSHSTLQQIGDEAMMLWSRSKVPVAVHPDRLAAARQLVTKGVDVIVSDDGLQHLRLARDIEIAVVDGHREHGNGRLLPAGPLRESTCRLSRVDYVVQNGETPVDDTRISMQLRGSTLRRLDDEQQVMALSELAGRRDLHALAGIGNPQRFFDALIRADLRADCHPFPDHHDYQENDLATFDQQWLVMTEKDAVKCRRFGSGQRWWYLPVCAELPEAFEQDLLIELEALRKS